MSYGKIFHCERCGKEARHGQSKKIFLCKACMFERRKKMSPPKDPRGRFTILYRDDFRCVYCGLSSIETHIELNVDHIVPFSMGGLNTASNLITSCFKCNMSKGHTILDEESTRRLLEEVKKRNTDKNINPDLIIKCPGRDFI